MEERKRWNRIMILVLLITSVAFSLSMLDIWYFSNTGKCMLHPYYDVVIIILSAGLFWVTLMAVVVTKLTPKN